MSLASRRCLQLRSRFLNSAKNIGEADSFWTQGVINGRDYLLEAVNFPVFPVFPDIPDGLSNRGGKLGKVGNVTLGKRRKKNRKFGNGAAARTLRIRK